MVLDGLFCNRVRVRVRLSLQLVQGGGGPGNARGGEQVPPVAFAEMLPPVGAVTCEARAV